jgi:carboxylesterase
VEPLTRGEAPAQSYEEALERFGAMLHEDTLDVDPLSRSHLQTSGRRVQRAILYLHGLTNSPRQFEVLSERFVARGYAVFAPRIPYHGYRDRMTTDLARLRVAQMVDMTAASIDLAAGLAEEVTVCGLSLGGVLAIWAAQYRPVAKAVAIAPSIGVPILPVAAIGPVFGALGRLPNRFVWWDPRYKEKLPGPPYAYPRFATHALVETQRLGLALMAAARQAPPKAAEVWLISNGADLAVSNAAGAELVKRWQAAGATNVHTFQFPRQLKLMHDVVDPLQPHSNPAYVHPILENIIAEGRVPSEVSVRTN